MTAPILFVYEGHYGVCFLGDNIVYSVCILWFVGCYCWIVGLLLVCVTDDKVRKSVVAVLLVLII